MLCKYCEEPIADPSQGDICQDCEIDEEMEVMSL